MGTRGFVGFVAGGTEKVAYNHWDSYPSGLGLDVLGWLRDADPERTRLEAHALRVVAADSVPTAEDVAALRPWTDLGVGGQSADDWYCLLRGTQGDPGATLQAGVLVDAGQFPRDSLFCEWGYVVDLDRDVFEAYRGFQTEPHDRGRFADRPPWRDEPSFTGDVYYPVALAASWPLGALPTEEEFLAALLGPDGEGEGDGD